MNIYQNYDKKICEIHGERQDRILRFLCLDNECNQDPLSCVLCIKQNHLQCDNKFLFDLNNFNKQIDFSSEDSNIKQKYTDSIKRLLYNMNIKAKRKVQKRIIEIFTFLQKQKQISQQKIFNENDLKWIKDEQDIYIDCDQNPIVAKSLCSVDRDNLKYSLDIFSRIQLANIQHYKNNLRKEQFFVNDNLQIFKDIKASLQLNYQLENDYIKVNFKDNFGDKKSTFFHVLIVDKFHKNLKVKIWNDQQDIKKIKGYCGFMVMNKVKDLTQQKAFSVIKAGKMTTDSISENKGFKYHFGMDKFSTKVGNKNQIQIPQNQILKMHYMQQTFISFEFKNGKEEDNICQLKDDSQQHVFFLAIKEKDCNFKLKFKVK